MRLRPPDRQPHRRGGAADRPRGSGPGPLFALNHQGETDMSIERLHSGPRMRQAVIKNGIVHLAGKVGAPGEDATAQTRSVLAQVDRLLAEAGADKSRLDRKSTSLNSSN